MSEPKVSVIVPVYNCEKYIERCMDSLINQTLADIEIIVIDDESKDTTFEILKEYEKKDKRIKLMTKKNSGISSSRNKGMEIATGKYIAFIDGDDWIDLDCLEKMYEVAEKNQTDIVICSYVREFKDHAKPKDIKLDENKIYQGEDLAVLHRRILGPIKEEFRNPESLDSIGSACGKLYKREIILKSGYRFIDLKEIGTAEDTLFNFMLFNEVTKISFIDKCFYHYWKENENSITTKYNPNLFNQWKNLFKYMEEFIKKNDLDNSFYESLGNRICVGVLGLGLNECKEDNNVSWRVKTKHLKTILNDKQIKEAYSKLELKYFPIHWKIFYCFNKYRIAFLSYMMLNTISILRKKI